jgi:hypothetical protein
MAYQPYQADLAISVIDTITWPWHGGPHPAGAGWGPPLSEFYEGRGILPLPALPRLMH